MRTPTRQCLVSIVAALLLATALHAQTPEPYGETIDVVRFILNVRVSVGADEMPEDVGPSDFSVEIDGRRVEVEAAEWISANGRGEDAAMPGRLIVVFVQTDFGRNSPRILQQMQFNRVADKIVAMFAPEDRVAVVSYDSHLKLRQDFTGDRTKALEAIRKSIEIAPASPDAPGDPVSLADHLDPKAMKNAARIDKGLLLLARALGEIKGDKLVLLAAGFGFGDHVRRGPLPEPEWHQAIREMQEDRVEVVSVAFGTGQGLATISRRTGGFAVSTEKKSLERLDNYFSGHFEITLKLSAHLEPGLHSAKVTIDRVGTSGSSQFLITEDDRSRRQEEERAALAEVARVQTLRAHELHKQAMEALLDENSVEAERLFGDAISLSPEFADPWFERGMLRAANGDLRSAASDLRKYLELAPGGRHSGDASKLLESLEDVD